MALFTIMESNIVSFFNFFSISKKDIKMFSCFLRRIDCVGHTLLHLDHSQGGAQIMCHMLSVKLLHIYVDSSLLLSRKCLRQGVILTWQDFT